MTDCKSFYREFLNIDTPYELQENLWQLLQEGRFPVFLKAPTGSGKTESVVAPFLNQFTTNKFTVAPRLIYVLPMRVLVNSVAERIKRYCSRVSPDITVKVQHGDAPGSPFFISDIVVTTLDQFVYGFTRSSREAGHHIDLPAGATASSLVVFDEAHMYRDELTFSVMRATMEILNVSRVPFVVMTATAPESLEKSLFENIKEYKKIYDNSMVSGKVTWSIAEAPLSIHDGLLEKIRSKRTLIVVNQVKRAQRLYEEIKTMLDFDESHIVLLHSRFTKEDRHRHEHKAISILPHKENKKIVVPKNAGIVVSTQVLEAGVDLSAELLLTEMAPADAIVQRVGRCARYTGQEAEVIIFPPEEDNGYKPYRKEHVEKTMKWLMEHPEFDFRDFDEVCTFVDETLDYRADDYEATDTLIDLFECVLYADQKPQNIQVRDGKPVTILVVEPALDENKKRQKKEDQFLNGIYRIYRNGKKISDYSFEVDIKTAWGWFKNRLLQYELQWKYDEKENKYKPNIINLIEKRASSPSDEDPRIGPFRTYILEKVYYDSLTGVKNDQSIFI